jgi:hypothetical protein
MDLGNRPILRGDCRLVALHLPFTASTDKQPLPFSGFKVYDGRIRYALAGFTKRRTYEEQSSQGGPSSQGQSGTTHDITTATKLLALEILNVLDRATHHSRIGSIIALSSLTNRRAGPQ